MSGNNKDFLKNRIYLDNAATTRVDERVIESMIPCFSEVYGNASSLHYFGTNAREVLETSRATIAQCMGARPDELFFTSSGTESNNWALKGIALANRNKGRHIIVSSIEHDCIMNTCKWLSEEGFSITYLPVDPHGIIDITALEEAINPKTILVSVMHANNEIGTIEPIEEVGRICKKHHVYFHSDACQSFGKIPIDVNKAGVDLLTINAHKIYGPKGIGALYIRKGVDIVPLLHGGGQESGLRSATENLPAIAGFAHASKLCFYDMKNEAERLSRLRWKLEEFISSNYEHAYVNGHPHQRLPGHLSFSFHGLEGETIRLLLLLDDMGIAVSAGSACSSNDKSNNASHVLQAIGLNPFEARGAIRVSLGRFNTEEEVDIFTDLLDKALKSLTSIFSGNQKSSLW
ncbi:MAG: cysteine desulfurase [Bacteroidales bacterium]|jgi:cysteine desulfurase|nr:cysteine desulfurase [Bacteroidales bacterium]